VIISSFSYKIDLLNVPLRWIPSRLTLENYYSLFFLHGSESVNAQHQRELENLQKSHRFTLIIVGVFAGVGFFGMLFFAVLLLRVMNRRTETLISQMAGPPVRASPCSRGTRPRRHPDRR
jgi:hypothetical protein